MKKPNLLILVLMVSIGPFSDTIFAPSLIGIKNIFLTNYENAELTISIYLFGYAFGQILYGPFSDSFGRKKTVFIGALIFFISSVFCMLSQNIIELIISRFIQGLGACASAVIATASIRDAFSLQEQTQVFAKINIAFVIAPALGALFGTIFIFETNLKILLALGVVLILTMVFFKETLILKNKSAILPKNFLLNYLKLFTSKNYLLFISMLGINIAIVYSMLIEAPAILNIIKLEKKWFILIALLIAISFMAGSLICNYFCKKNRDLKIIIIGIMLECFGSFMIFSANYNNHILIFLISSIIFIFLGIALIIPISTSKALSSFSKNIGSASAMLGFWQMFLASVITTSITFIHLNHLLRLSLIIFCCVLLEVVLIFFIFLKKSSRVHPA